MNTNTEGRGDFSLVLRIQEQGVLCCDGEKLVSELHQLCQLLQFLWEATPWHQDQIRLLAACFTVTACILAQIHQSCTCWQFSTAYTLSELFQGPVSRHFSIRTRETSHFSISVTTLSTPHRTYPQELAKNPRQLASWN